MKNIIKESKKLNYLIDKLFTTAYEVGSNINLVSIINADYFVMTNEDKYRSAHFDLSLREGIRLIQKSSKINKPIYCAWYWADVSELNDFIFYFVDDLVNIQKHLTSKIKEFEVKLDLSTDLEIEKLEERLELLKKSKK